jgi:hypothetical protein
MADENVDALKSRMKKLGLNTSLAQCQNDNIEKDYINVNYVHYGENCGGTSANSGNTLSDIQNICNGKSSCEYKVNHQLIGDPAVGCAKDYTVSYKCGEGMPKITTLAPEASGKSFTLSCSGIEVQSTHYGQNCGTAQNSGSSFSHAKQVCDGKTSCTYRVNHQSIGDPAVGCAKDYKILYRCGQGVTKTATISREASGKSVELTCTEKSRDRWMETVYRSSMSAVVVKGGPVLAYNENNRYSADLEATTVRTIYTPPIVSLNSKIIVGRKYYLEFKYRSNAYLFAGDMSKYNFGPVAPNLSEEAKTFSSTFTATGGAAFEIVAYSPGSWIEIDDITLLDLSEVPVESCYVIANTEMHAVDSGISSGMQSQEFWIRGTEGVLFVGRDKRRNFVYGDVISFISQSNGELFSWGGHNRFQLRNRDGNANGKPVIIADLATLHVHKYGFVKTNGKYGEFSAESLNSLVIPEELQISLSSTEIIMREGCSVTLRSLNASYQVVIIILTPLNLAIYGLPCWLHILRN